MFDLLLGCIEYLLALDSAARQPASPSWLTRHKTLIRVVVVMVMAPVVILLGLLLIDWLIHLGATGRKVVLGVLVIQLLGILAMLDRRRKA
ncbi:hypothetical protein [Pseudomonas putida]